MKPSEIIREGRNQLFEKGWGQGRYRNRDGTVCAVGAVIEVDPESVVRDLLAFEDQSIFSTVQPSPNARVALEHLLAAIPQQGSKWDGDPQWKNIPEYNDAPNRTFDEVVEVFDRAEKIALVAEENGAVEA